MADIVKDQSYAFEVRRKVFHLIGLSMPLLYRGFAWPIPFPGIERATAAAILGAITAGLIVLDVARWRWPTFSVWFDGQLEGLMRHHERGGHVTGSTWLIGGAFATVLCWPKEAAVLALAYIIVGDTAGALIGRRFGKHKLWKGARKSWEGALAFVAACMLVTLALGQPLSPRYVIASVVAATVEALPLPLDDNLSVPVATGALLWAMTALGLQ